MRLLYAFYMGSICLVCGNPFTRPFLLIGKDQRIKADIKGLPHMANAPPPCRPWPARPTQTRFGVPTQKLFFRYSLGFAPSAALRIDCVESSICEERSDPDIQQVPQGMSFPPFCPCHPRGGTCVVWDLWAESLWDLCFAEPFTITSCYNYDSCLPLVPPDNRTRQADEGNVWRWWG